MFPGLDDAQRELVERALVYAGGTHTVEDIEAKIDVGRLQFWPGARSIVITEILQYPRLKELHFFLAAGDMTDLRTLYPFILAWGKDQGCARAVFVGRPGWAKTFLTRTEGWTHPAVVFEKDLG